MVNMPTFQSSPSLFPPYQSPSQQPPPPRSKSRLNPRTPYDSRPPLPISSAYPATTQKNSSRPLLSRPPPAPSPAPKPDTTFYEDRFDGVNLFPGLRTNTCAAV